MSDSTYYPQACCPQTNAPQPTPLPGDIVSSSHEFRDAQTLNSAALLAQSGFGNGQVHSVDIDVRATDDGVALMRGGGQDVLHTSGTRDWSGAVTVNNEYRTATDFSLVMADGDVVVVNWTEIVA